MAFFECSKKIQNAILQNIEKPVVQYIIQTYCQRGFIWMVTPYDFINRLKSYNYITCLH